jgi:hypothetical protein
MTKILLPARRVLGAKARNGVKVGERVYLQKARGTTARANVLLEVAGAKGLCLSWAREFFGSRR